MESNAGYKGCAICNDDEDDYYDRDHHIRTEKHRFNFMLFEFDKRRKIAVLDREEYKISASLILQNRTGVEVHTDTRKGVFTIKMSPGKFNEIGREIKIMFTGYNGNRTCDVLVNLLHPYPAFQMENDNSHFELENGDSFKKIVIFKQNQNTLGSFKIPISFWFQPKAKPDKYINIYRLVTIYIIEKHIEEVSFEASPFKGDLWKNVKIIGPTKSMRMINNFPIPEDMKMIIMHGLAHYEGINSKQNLDRISLENIMKDPCLSMENYKTKFHTLLWLDECGCQLGLLKYNMTNIKLKLIRDEYFELDVPGLGEKRPSIIVGDLINIRAHGDHTAYQAQVTQISDKSIYIRYAHSELIQLLKAYPDCEMDVNFQLTRLLYERMHEGVEGCFLNGMLGALFPKKMNSIIVPPKLQKNDLFNQNLNNEQLRAVEYIVDRKSMVPYIIFGPPGTGKTVTLVEAVLQLKKRRPKLNILICAPSNAACDMLTLKLGEHCNVRELLRVQSQTRQWAELNPIVKIYSNLQDDEYIVKRGSELKAYNIVISTLHLIGKYSGDYSPDFLFIDEAAQATEPECDIPIGLLTPDCPIVLAGDPKQLGPVISSKSATKYGLERSLLERLMETNELYAPKRVRPLEYDPLYLTMLIQNYRSHADIIAIPNELFYNMALQTMPKHDPLSYIQISNAIHHGSLRLNGKKSSAVEFCAMSSKEQRTGGSPSYFNQAEIDMVIKYVKAFFELSNCKVIQSDIGIIAPYIRQVCRIRAALEKLNYKDIEVGTTESFQGQEKRVIIISTVRAQHSLLRYDKKYKLGFVKSERRFNVALTRAISKVIVIGNPLCLMYDKKCWGRYVGFCEDKSSYFGVINPERTSQVRSEIMTRLKM